MRFYSASLTCESMRAKLSSDAQTGVNLTYYEDGVIMARFHSRYKS